MIKKVIATAISIVTVIFYGYLVNLVSEFKVMFNQANNTELPVSTSLLLSSYYVFILLSIVSLIGLYFIFQNKKQGWWYISIPGGLVFLILPFTVWALYLPVANT